MQCPKCSGDTEVTAYDEIRVDRCTQCGGLWFDTGELEQLRKDTWMADHVLDRGNVELGKAFDKVRNIKCPQCNEAMVTEHDEDQTHICYEACPNGHGSFLDAGEFTDMVNKTFWDRFKRAR